MKLRVVFLYLLLVGVLLALGALLVSFGRESFCKLPDVTARPSTLASVRTEPAAAPHAAAEDVRPWVDKASPARAAASAGGSEASIWALLSAGSASLLQQGGVHIVDTDALAPAVAAGRSRLFPGTGGVDEAFGQYSLEHTLVRLVQESPFVAASGREAALYLVPQYATFETHGCLNLNIIQPDRLRACAANVTRDYLMPLILAVQATPAYKRHNGSDHLWVFPWDLSWQMFPGVPEALATNLFFGFIGPERNLVAVPVTSRVVPSVADIERNSVFGGHSLAFSTARLAQPGRTLVCAVLPPHKYLASFAGNIFPTRTYSNGIRQDLLALYSEANVSKTGILVLDRHIPADEYMALLRDSLFCLSPQGWTPWSQRLYFAVAVGCIPVFFDRPGWNMPLPFNGGLLDWSAMSVVVPDGPVSRVEGLLRAISAEDVCRMRGRLASAKAVLLWSYSPELTLLASLTSALHKFQRGQ